LGGRVEGLVLGFGRSRVSSGQSKFHIEKLAKQPDGFIDQCLDPQTKAEDVILKPEK
jgi:hypothetical protein